MKNLKTIVALVTVPLLLLSFSNCGGAQQFGEKITFVQIPPFKIAEAQFQNWVAGTKEGGSGTYVTIIFSEMDPNVEIQNIYFRNQILEPKNNVNAPLKYTGYLKNDMSRDVVMHTDPMKEAQNTIEKPFPLKLEENQAVVEYWFGGEKNYYKIAELSQKETIPYPQANPNSHE